MVKKIKKLMLEKKAIIILVITLLSFGIIFMIYNCESIYRSVLNYKDATNSKNVHLYNKKDLEAIENGAKIMDIGSSEDIKVLDILKKTSEETNPDEEKQKEIGPLATCIVRQSEMSVDNDYFKDVVFVGDSITNGLQLYQVAKDAVIISKTSLNIENLVKDPIMIDGKSILEKIKETNRKKIYIMIGSNGIGWLEDEYMIDSYKKWLNEIRQEIPESIIYIESVLPITKKLSESNEKKETAITNEKIERYNKKLIAMCEEENYNYLNISEEFKDENNNLFAEASPVDGMHINSKYYNKWLNYIKNHTIPG